MKRIFIYFYYALFLNFIYVTISTVAVYYLRWMKYGLKVKVANLYFFKLVSVFIKSAGDMEISHWKCWWHGFPLLSALPSPAGMSGKYAKDKSSETIPSMYNCVWPCVVMHYQPEFCCRKGTTTGLKTLYAQRLALKKWPWITIRYVFLPLMTIISPDCHNN